MAPFNRNTRQTRRDYFGFSFITILFIVSVQVLLCSARPNQDGVDNENPVENNPNGVIKSTKELPLMDAEEEPPLDNGGSEDEEEEDEDEDTLEEGEDITPKKYVEPRETSSTSTIQIPHLLNKVENNYNNEDADQTNDENTEGDSQGNSGTTTDPSSSSSNTAEKDNTNSSVTINHGLKQKNYCLILFISVLSYFLM